MRRLAKTFERSNSGDTAESRQTGAYIEVARMAAPRLKSLFVEYTHIYIRTWANYATHAQIRISCVLCIYSRTFSLGRVN